MDTLTNLISQIDHWHVPTPGDAEHKEWQHFCILGPEVQVILNWSLSGNSPRVIALAREGAGNWEGDVDSIPARDARLAPARVDARLGHNTLEFEKGVYILAGALQERPVAFRLELRPHVLPWLMHDSLPMADGVINWLVVPRLTASGTVVIGQHVHSLKDAPAYHDHNWGRWLWGQDFAWQWGFVLESKGLWSLVLCRTLDRARHRTLDLKLALWKGQRLCRVFTHREIQVEQTGYLRRKRVTKYPRVMALVAPEPTTDVPRELDLAARSGGDEVRCRFHSDDLAQVVIPNETDLDSTLVNQVVGRAELEGRIAGETLNLEGQGVFEFLTA